jgi:hypothetical protein
MADDLESGSLLGGGQLMAVPVLAYAQAADAARREGYDAGVVAAWR